MAFIRIKKIKGNDYAYLVENQYRKRGNPVKQKSRKYLGRIHSPSLLHEEHFLEWTKGDPKTYIDSSSPEKILSDLISWELYRHGIEQKKLEKKQVLRLHEGFLCEYTRKEIIKIMHTISVESGKEEEYEREHAVLFAESFVKAGIKIPESVFIALFRKLHG